MFNGDAASCFDGQEAEPSASGLPLVDRGGDAVLFRTGRGDITHAAFARDVLRCAALLPAFGHVVNGCASRYWFAVGFAAALVRGQVSLLTGDHAPRNLAALAGQVGGAYFLSDDVAGVGPLPRVVIGAGDATRGPASLPRIPACQEAAIVFTSGSTGEPAGTRKNFAELAARSRAAAERFGFADGAPATIIGTVPPHHMYGFETTVLLPFHANVSSWCDPVFYPADLQAALAATTGAVLVTTPLHLRAMLAIGRPARPPACVISATAPLDPDLAAEAERLWGAPTLEIFGATEVGSIASRRTTDGADWLVYPGVALRGEDGPMVTAPYAEPRRLSDVVELLDGGERFRLVGRCGDMVKLGGRRASLAGLTRVLTALPGVEDGVFLAPDDLDARPTARLMALFVSSGPGVEAVLAALRQRIDPVFLPRPLVQVPGMPRNALGKLRRDALLALVAAREVQ
jgi:acyl-coenzyme A synthetase/AMP-(fatty) acid ligase